MWGPPVMPGAGQQAPPQMPGQSQPKLEPIDWNLVAVLDADLIRRTKDYDSLQKLMQIFLTAKITQGNSRILSHPLVVRLCQLLQVGVEYLNYCQNELQAHISKIETENMEANEKIKVLEHKLEKTELVLKVKSRPYHRCPVCDKKFKGLDFIDRHILNKHSELMDAWDVIRGRKSPQQQDSVQQILDKIDNLRNTLKKDDSRNRKQIKDQIFQTQKEFMDAEDVEDEESMKKREEMRRQFFMAADELNSSINLWEEQKTTAPAKRMNIFKDDTPVTREMPEVPQHLFGKANDIEVAGPNFDKPEAIFSYQEDPASPVKEEKKEVSSPKFPKKYTKDVKKSAREFISARGSESPKAKKQFAEPNVEGVMSMISEKLRGEVAKMQSNVYGKRLTPEIVQDRMGQKDEAYLETRQKLAQQLERECPMTEPVSSQPNPKPANDFFEMKDNSDYSDFTEEQLTGTAHNDILERKSSSENETAEAVADKQEDSTKPIAGQEMDPSALTEGDTDDEFTSAFDLGPKIIPLDAKEEEIMFQSFMSDVDDEEDANSATFASNHDVKPEQEEQKSVHEYEYEYSYTYEGTEKAPVTDIFKVDSVSLLASPERKSVLASAKLLPKEKADDTKALFQSDQSSDSPVKHGEIDIALNKPAEVDYEKLAMEKYRKEFDFVFDNDTDDGEVQKPEHSDTSIESVHIEPLYTTVDMTNEFNISRISSSESSQIQKQTKFQLSSGPSAISIAPKSPELKITSPRASKRSPWMSPPSPTMESEKSWKHRKTKPVVDDFSMQMVKQAVELSSGSETTDIHKKEMEMDEYELNFSRDPPQPRRSYLDDSDDDFKLNYARKPDPEQKPERPGVEIVRKRGNDDEKFVPKKKLRQTFYESPRKFDSSDISQSSSEPEVLGDRRRSRRGDRF